MKTWWSAKGQKKRSLKTTCTTIGAKQRKHIEEETNKKSQKTSIKEVGMKSEPRQTDVAKGANTWGGLSRTTAIQRRKDKHGLNKIVYLVYGGRSQKWREVSHQSYKEEKMKEDTRNAQHLQEKEEKLQEAQREIQQMKKEKEAIQQRLANVDRLKVELAEKSARLTAMENLDRQREGGKKKEDLDANAKEENPSKRRKSEEQATQKEQELAERLSILEALARKEKETGRETNTEEKKENSGGTRGMHRSKDRHTWEQETKGDQDRRAPRRGESHWKEASRDRSPSVKRERESKRDKEYEDNRKHQSRSRSEDTRGRSRRSERRSRSRSMERLESRPWSRSPTEKIIAGRSRSRREDEFEEKEKKESSTRVQKPLSLTDLGGDIKGKGAQQVESTEQQMQLSQLISTISANQTPGDNKGGIQVPSGFIGGTHHRITGEPGNTMSAQTYVRELELYIKAMERKSGGLIRTAELNRAIMRNIADSWETQRKALAAKIPSMGTQRLKVQQQFLVIPEQMRLPKMEDMTTTEFIEIFKEVYMKTEAQRDGVLKAYLNCKQNEGEPLWDYYMYFLEKQQDLDSIWPESSYVGDMEHISQFIKSVRHSQVQMQLRGQAFSSKMRLLEYMTTLMKSEPQVEEEQAKSGEKKMSSIQERLGTTGRTTQGGATQPLDGSRSRHAPQDSNSFAVFCFRCVNVWNGTATCTNCGKHNHQSRECYLKQEGVQPWRVEAGKQANQFDRDAGYVENDAQSYIKEWRRLSEEKKMAGSFPQRRSEEGGAAQRSVENHHRLTGSNTVQMSPAKK